MKSLVKIVISVLALGVMASVPMLRAQDESAPPAQGKGGGRGGRGGKGGGMMTVASIEQAVGSLTDDQKAKIGDILAKAQKDMQARRDGGGDPQSNMAAMQEINASMRKDIRAVLTADQQTKFDAMPQPGRGGGGGRGKKGGGN
jgi:periplasmic protein CpxP/Spy